MTRANALRKIFKKFFGIDAKGNSVSAVLNDVINNNETLPSGDGGGGGVVHLYFEADQSSNISWVGQSYTSIEIYEMIENHILLVVHISDGILDIQISKGTLLMSHNPIFDTEIFIITADGTILPKGGGNAV